jgi:hypothetical protein
MNCDTQDYLLKLVLAIKDDLEGRRESVATPEPCDPAVEVPTSDGNGADAEPRDRDEIVAMLDDKACGADWDDSESDEDEDDDEEEEGEDEDEWEHPAAKFIDDCLSFTTVRSRRGRIVGAIFLRCTGGPHIEVFTEQRLIVGNWGGCSPVAINYIDQIGLEDYVLDCFAA